MEGIQFTKALPGVCLRIALARHNHNNEIDTAVLGHEIPTIINSPTFISQKERVMGLLLLLVLVLLLVGGLPSWGYSRSWGYGPSGVMSAVLVVVVVMIILGYIPRGF
jgi:hypothetical protein